MLSAAKTLSFTYEIFGSEQDKVAVFDLSSSMEAIDEFRSRCAMENTTDLASTVSEL